MFDKNIMTFNPGWGPGGTSLDDFEDIRDIQERYRAAGITFSQEVEKNTKGPASFIIEDPDGNPILVDQHRD